MSTSHLLIPKQIRIHRIQNLQTFLLSTAAGPRGYPFSSVAATLRLRKTGVGRLPFTQAKPCGYDFGVFEISTNHCRCALHKHLRSYAKRVPTKRATHKVALFMPRKNCLYFPNRFLNSSVIMGTAVKRSATMPKVAILKIGASGSLLIATMISEVFIPA